MKKKKVSKKLVLNKRTVIDFSRDEMKNMKGGVETVEQGCTLACTLTCTLKAICCGESLECTMTCPDTEEWCTNNYTQCVGATCGGTTC